MTNWLDRLEGRVLLSVPVGAVEAAPGPVAAGRPAVRGMPLARPAKPVAQRPPAVATPLWVNAGGLGSVDSLGRRFEGGNGFLGGATSQSAFEVDGTGDDSLFWAYREGAAFTFKQIVANGNYDLWLEFVEPDAGAEPGGRTFDVAAEGSLVLD